LSQSTRVTDRRTDGQTDGQTDYKSALLLRQQATWSHCHCQFCNVQSVSPSRSRWLARSAAAFLVSLLACIKSCRHYLSYSSAEQCLGDICDELVGCCILHWIKYAQC